MAVKSKTAEILYAQMLRTSVNNVARTALKLIDSIQSDRVEDQVLAIAAVLVCMLNQYGLSHIDVLGIADNMVFSGANNNMKPDFKVITKFMKEEWRI